MTFKEVTTMSFVLRPDTELFTPGIYNSFVFSTIFLNTATLPSVSTTIEEKLKAVYDRAVRNALSDRDSKGPIVKFVSPNQVFFLNSMVYRNFTVFSNIGPNSV